MQKVFLVVPRVGSRRGAAASGSSMSLPVSLSNQSVSQSVNQCVDQSCDGSDDDELWSPQRQQHHVAFSTCDDDLSMWLC